MDQSMRRYMRVGLISFMAFPDTMKGEGPILESIRRIAADDSFDFIELSHIQDPQARKAARAMLDQAHIGVGYGAQPRLLTSGLNLNDLDGKGRRKAVDLMLESIDEAYALGAAGLGFLSGKYREEAKEQAFDALAESVSEMCRYAKARGEMKILLEVFDYDVDKCSLIGPAPLARRFAQRMAGHENFGLIVDLSHIPLLHETIRESLEPVKEFIKHAHMGNAVVKPGLPAYGDAHPRFGFPGSENDVKELAEYLRALIDIGYLKEGQPGIVSFEVKPFGSEDPELVIANAKRTLNAAWALV